MKKSNVTSFPKEKVLSENNLTEGQALGWFTIEQIKKKNMAWEVHKFIEFKNEKKV